MNPSELADRLSRMHANSREGESTTMIRLFGIMFADEIRDCGASPAQLATLARLSDTYAVEINKGIQLAAYVVVRPGAVVPGLVTQRA